ncbi:MAG: DMT family transporter [Patescibacteria group bacterium]
MLSTRTKALLALICTGILGGLAPIFMKVALREITPIEIAFTRFFFTFILLIPFALIKKVLTFEKQDFTHILGASLLFSGNILLFVLGLQFTTSIVSQLLFLLLPSLVILWSFLFLKQKVQVKHIISIFLGLVGGLILVVRIGNNDLFHSLGTTKGNLIVLGAVICWSLYIITSKKISTKYNPLSLLVANSITVSVLSMVFLFFLRIPLFTVYFHLSTQTLISLLYLVFFNSILFFFMYQWAIKLVKPFSVSMSAYLSPLSAALLAIPFLGEKISLQLILSGALIAVSSYMAFRKK